MFWIYFCVWCEGHQLHCGTYDYQTFPIPLADKTVLTPLSILASFVKIEIFKYIKLRIAKEKSAYLLSQIKVLVFIPVVLRISVHQKHLKCLLKHRLMSFVWVSNSAGLE